VTPYASRTRPRRVGRILLSVWVTVCCLLVSGAGDARAEDPVTLDRQSRITDRVGALGSHEARVRTVIESLRDTSGIQLFVAYVHDFSGRSAQGWADSTAARNSLGRDSVLLAVATHDRRYACSAGPGSPLTGDRLAAVGRTAIEPALRQNDWAGAAIGAANGYGAVLAGRPVPTPTITHGVADPGDAAADGGAAGNLVLPVVVVVAAAAAATYTFMKRRRRAATRTTPGSGQQDWGSADGPSGRR
jgi:uncharacterized membrane protein YgcG